MARPRKKGNLTSSQRTDFERQIFALCLKNEEFKKIVQKAYQDFSFIYEETQMPQAEFGRKYCEIILQNNNLLYPFCDIPKKLGEPPSSYYVYRNDVIEKIYAMAVKAQLI